MRIVVFGDSITWGANDPVHGGWVTLLRNELEPKDIAVYNCGIRGDTTTDLTSRFEGEARARRAEAVIFAIGINDSRYTGTRENPCVPIHDFKTNIEALINQARAITAKVCFVGLTAVNEAKTMPTIWSPDSFYDNENVGRYDSALRELCEMHNVPFIPMPFDIELDEDGLHPNTAGHRRMYEVVREFVVTEFL